jgi:hypothetical protein
MGLFLGRLGAAWCDSGWLVGLVQEILGSLRSNKGLSIPSYLGKANSNRAVFSMFSRISLKNCNKNLLSPSL